MLPKKAAICKQFRKCGKPSCKCNAGSLHGPYFFHFYREDGKLRKKHIRKADAGSAFDLYQSERRFRQLIKRDFAFWRSLQHEIREVEQYVRTNEA